MTYNVRNFDKILKLCKSFEERMLFLTKVFEAFIAFHLISINHTIA